MNFRSRQQEAPEINLIPFIDVLLVVLIFLVLSTTYSKFTEIQLTLPVADVDVQRDYPKEMIVVVGIDGAYSINRTAVTGRSVEEMTIAMSQSAKAGKDTVVIISADASARHQSVITAMEAARRAGLNQITFVTQYTTQVGGK
jgi:biopolymer transport protein ExbD